MELDERKTIILKAIIKSYLETGDPVGSRTISKLCGLNLSSATIRNEMSDLVEMGYIEQPHTSAGRVPTDKGYRFYVDSIESDNDRRITAVTSQMLERVDKLEQLLKNTVKALASDTKYAALISGPNTSTVKIKYIQLSVPSEKKVLMLIVLDGNVIKNEMLTIEESMNYETAMSLTVMLNNHLSGLSLRDITPKLITDIMVQAGTQSGNVKIIIDSIVEMLEQGENNHEIFTSGAKNIFRYPELSDNDRASLLITAFEEKDKLNDLVNEVTELSTSEGNEGGNVRVYIGGEGPVKNMKDCSLITASYELGEGMTGVIGVIGPKRMDYERVMHTINGIKDQLDNSFSDSSRQEGR